MDKNKSLIIGINSFLAKALYRQIKSSSDVVGIYNNNQHDLPPELSVLSINEIDKLANQKWDCIYLIGAYIPKHQDKNIDKKLYKANVEMPQKIHQLFPDARIVFCSSVSVYENSNDEVLSINSVPCPGSKYGLSKLWGEEIIKEHSSFAIARISSMYGPGMNRGTFLPVILENAIKKGEIKLFGKGNRYQNYIYVDDVAKLLATAGNIDENNEFLAVADKSYTNKEVAEFIAKCVSTKIVYEGKDDAKSYIYDNQKTKNMLQFNEKMEIGDGIEELVRWLEKKY